MTKEQRREKAKQDVQETLALIEKYGFEYVDLAEHRRRTRFFYRQSNEQIGVIIPYHSALKMNGEPKVCYELHCFDINVVYAHNISEAVDCVMRDNSNVMLDFWIPSFRASKPNHAYILDCLCKETETDKDKLEAKYSSLKKGTRCWGERIREIEEMNIQHNIMEKVEREFTLDFDPKRYLDQQGNLRLPEPIRAYVGPVGYEYDQLTHAQRLVDLGYLVTRGFDIKHSIRRLLDDHPDYEDDVMQGIYYLLLEMRGYEGACWLDPMEEKISGFKLLNLLVKDLPLYYELEGDVFEPESPYMDRPIVRYPSVHGIKNMKWDMEAVAKDKPLFTQDNVFALQKLTTEEWIQKGYGFMKEEEVFV